MQKLAENFRKLKSTQIKCQHFRCKFKNWNLRLEFTCFVWICVSCRFHYCCCTVKKIWWIFFFSMVSRDHEKCVCCLFNWVDSIKNCAVNFQPNYIDTPTRDVRFRFSGSHRRFYSLIFQRSGWIATKRRYVHSVIPMTTNGCITRMHTIFVCSSNAYSFYSKHRTNDGKN